MRAGRGQVAHGGERGVHRELVNLARAGFGDQRGRLVAERARIFLAEFLAAAMALHIAVSADIDDEVVSVEAATEAAQDFIAAGAGLERDIDDLGAARFAPAARHFIELAEGAVGDGIEKGCHDVRSHLRRAHQIDAGRLGGLGARRQILRGPLAQVVTRTDGVLVRFGVARQGRR